MFPRSALALFYNIPSRNSVTVVLGHTARLKLKSSTCNFCAPKIRHYSKFPIEDQVTGKDPAKKTLEVSDFMKYTHPLSQKDASGNYVGSAGKSETADSSRKPSADVSIKKKFFNFDAVQDASPTEAWKQLSSMGYEEFDASGSRIIYDVTEEMLGISDGKPLQSAPLEAPSPSPEDLKLSKINLKRGKEGVFDLQDLVEVLNLENAKDLVAIKIPAEMHFVDHMVIVTAKSQRHLSAIANVVRKVYNLKKHQKKDPALILEGRDTPWVAMDLGNIALHVMSPSERKRMDMEMLWLCGPEHDVMMQHQDSAKEDDLFSLVDPVEEPVIEAQPYDITKLYDHPYQPVWADDTLPDHDEINDDNRNTFTATSLMEIALRKHNKEHARKFRGRFRK